METQAFDSEKFLTALDPAGIQILSGEPQGEIPILTAAHRDLFARHAALVVEANRAFNLTRITDPAEMAAKHYLDSISCCLCVDFTRVKKALDVGSGAGFPGVPLAITFPEIEFTLLEATGKKARFLESAIAELGLTKCTVVADRAEIAGRGHLREAFDLVVGRAIGEARVLAELCAPFLLIKGILCMQKGKSDVDELKRYEAVADLLGLKAPKYIELQIAEAGRRSLLISKKASPTPDRFPRRPGIPEKRPLKR